VHRVIISAPFGNYRWFQFPYTTPTLGTFTLHKRAGTIKRIWRVAKTLRYTRAGWVNRLGLPNPGIQSLTGKSAPSLEGKLVSVATTHDGDEGLDELRWLLDVLDKLHPLAFEYNMSCPNVAQASSTIAQQATQWANWLSRRPGRQLIVKIPPVGYEEILYEFGDFADYFHCCNTLPTPGGGLSGPALRPLVHQALRSAKKIAPDVPLIAGGGVRTYETAMEYVRRGADYVAIASMLLNPFNYKHARRLSEWAENAPPRVTTQSHAFSTEG